MTLPLMAGMCLCVVAAHSHKVHAALGAITRLIGDHFRVHRAGVLSGLLLALLRVFLPFYVLLSHVIVSVTLMSLSHTIGFPSLLW
jgi:hypothetical protein